MRNDTPRLGVREPQMDILQELYLFEKILVGLKVDQNDNPPPLLGQHDGAPRLPDFS